MKRLVLQDTLLTGIPGVDEQHRELYAWGNVLLFPAGLVAEDLEFVEALEFLAGYVRYHFTTEEQAMERCGYPRYEAHRWQHRHFRHEIEQLVAETRRGDPGRAVKHRLHYLLQDWFTGHIRYSDQRFAAWLREHPELEPLIPPDEQALRSAGLDPTQLRVVRAEGSAKP